MAWPKNAPLTALLQTNDIVQYTVAAYTGLAVDCSNKKFSLQITF